MQYATLVWFDSQAGEGMVELANGELVYLHYSTICGIDSNGYQYPSNLDRIILDALRAGDRCKVSIYENLYSKRVDKCDFALVTREGE